MILFYNINYTHTFKCLIITLIFSSLNLLNLPQKKDITDVHPKTKQWH